ncbi:MAG TPA: histidinol phosphate phosphatase domain-containing protein [Tepiditoga sp.]|nr:histidinol phosphate phosphatase domain-containing protein [Thermotogota bacterium]HOO75461.1 histidinol phosphate phosphatase domain-containing protein [Tepiditoga sp.]
MKKIHDFHTHTFLSDGVLLPSEQISWAIKNGYQTIAITDHADHSNVNHIIKSIKNFKDKQQKYYDIKILCGIEITHVPPKEINSLAEYARLNGADIIVVHGETLAEPVPPETNLYALKSDFVDILAHPGLLSEEEAQIAKSNGKFIEITTRPGHSASNGIAAKLHSLYNFDLIINSDSHGPKDFNTYEKCLKILLGCGIEEHETEKIMFENPEKLLKKIRER